MNNYIKEIKAFIIITVFFLLTLLILFLPQIVSPFISLKIFLISFFSYILLIILSYQLAKITKNNIILKINKILFFPIYFFFTFFTFVIPIGMMIIHIFLYFGTSFLIPTIIVLVANLFLDNNTLTQETSIYLRITLSAFIMVIFNYQIRNFVHTISPARFKTSKKLKPYKLDKMSEYLLSEDNIRFIVYSVYVIFLILINLTYFQIGTGFFQEHGKAILQSFVTFIAFDRAINILKNLKFKPSDFLKMIIKSIRNKIEDLENKNS